MAKRFGNMRISDVNVRTRCTFMLSLNDAI